MANAAGRQLTVKVDRVLGAKQGEEAFYVVANDLRVSGFYMTPHETWVVADKLLKRWGCSLPDFGDKMPKPKRGVVHRYVFTWKEKDGETSTVLARSFEATTAIKARHLLCIALGRKRCPHNMTTKEHQLDRHLGQLAEL